MTTPKQSTQSTQSHCVYRRHKYGFYISTIQSPQYQVCGVMDDYGDLIDVSDDAFDASIYFYIGTI